MEAKITETVDSSLTVTNNSYTVTENRENYLLKTIHIPKKEPFVYAFLGGMWYSKNKFSLDTDTISLPYPFTTYYTLKIFDKKIDEVLCKSAIYVKMPVCVIQFPKKCIVIKFDPCISVNNQDVFPFIQLNETTDSYIISFYLATSYTIKQKDHEWLGKGKKTEQTIDVKTNDSFEFATKILEFERWDQAIYSIFKTSLQSKSDDTFTKPPKQVFTQAKKALWRSYDHKRGTFLQLPWRETPGFTFVDSSYSLLSYEAVRLDYFSRWYSQTNDEDFADWTKKLHGLFINPMMHTTPKKQGKGIIWYNMTTLSKKGLTGYFYMDTGYAGYPGGQATIDLHLLNYLQHHTDETLEQLIKQSLTYILSTQNTDGSWPMAIKQKGILKFRPEKLHEFKSYGGTAEAVRALFKGANYFDNPEMKNAAVEGLKFLVDTNPICYNGLRDIGIMEPEAFSAVSIINAFLDGYEETKNTTYLDGAKIYAAYTLPWIYQWNAHHLSFFFNFHPISYSITPRLSPYETAWIISTYHRLSEYTTDKDLWNATNKALFNHVTSWISKTGGLSEGIFPNGFSGFTRLPMEQTFATVELMNSANTLMEKGKEKKKEKPSMSIDESIHFEKNKSVLNLYNEKDKILTFNASKAKITHIHNASLREMGITFSFFGSYQKSGLKRKIKKQLRGNIGKFINGSKDALYAITGVKGPKPIQHIHLDLIQQHITSSSIKIHSPNKATSLIQLPLHTILLTFNVVKKEENLYLTMNIEIIVNEHDLPVTQLILFPVIDAKPKKITDKKITFNGFSLHGDCSNIIQKDSFTAINQTLTTNWTHAGICKKRYTLSIPLK